MLNILNILLTGMLLVLSADNPFGNRRDLGLIESGELKEISGIDAGILNRDVFWVHNDSGNDPRIFAIGKDGKLLAAFELTGAIAIDMEDITLGSGPEEGISYIYLADIGDNTAVRETKTILRFKEPIIKANGDLQTGKIDDIEVFSFSYPDGRRDAETLMLDEKEKKLLVVSKREDSVIVYSTEIPDAGTTILQFNKIAVLPFGNEGYTNSGVTGGDISKDGNEILIKTYAKVYYYLRENNESLSEVLLKRPVEVDYKIEPQSEAICFGNEHEGFYTTSEASPLNITPHLYFYPRNTNGMDDGSMLDGHGTLRDDRLLSSDAYNIVGRKLEFNSASQTGGLYLMRYRYIDTAFTRKIFLVK